MKKSFWSYLKIDEKIVQLFLVVARVEVNSASIENGAHKSNSKQMVGRIQVRSLIRSGPESDKRVEDSKDDSGIDESVVVELGQELDYRDSALVVLRHVNFHHQSNVLQNVVQNLRPDPFLREQNTIFV